MGKSHARKGCISNIGTVEEWVEDEIGLQTFFTVLRPNVILSTRKTKKMTRVKVVRVNKNQSFVLFVFREIQGDPCIGTYQLPKAFRS